MPGDLTPDADALSQLTISECSPSTAWRSSSIELRTNAYSGRGLFPKYALPASTPLHRTAPLSEPIVAFIYRPYRRREVCQRCFAYDPDGRDKVMKVRDADAGMAWCNDECRRQWMAASDGQIALDAWCAVEAHIKKRSKSKRDPKLSDDDPSSEQVTAAWNAAEQLGQAIVEARSASTCSKAQRRLISSTSDRHLEPDVVTYLLAGVLAARASAPTLWQSLLDLQPGSHLFWSEHDLVAHVDAYLHLLCVLPLPLISSCTPSAILAIISRDAHNSFGLHSLDDDGSEWFGHAIFPSASYFNHACRPNVAKDRTGRAWTFTTRRAVTDDEELCISYLGEEGEEHDLSRRRRDLWRSWRFVCACSTCRDEEAALQKQGRPIPSHVT